MNFRREIATLVQQYIKATKGRDVTVDSILDHPWHKVVGWWWKALVHFKHEGWYATLEEIEPVEGMYVNIVKKDKVERYERLNGKWSDMGYVTEGMYK